VAAENGVAWQGGEVGRACCEDDESRIWRTFGSAGYFRRHAGGRGGRDANSATFTLTMGLSYAFSTR
jgi:hypothetical protein